MMINHILIEILREWRAVKINMRHKLLLFRLSKVYADVPLEPVGDGLPMGRPLAGHFPNHHQDQTGPFRFPARDRKRITGLKFSGLNDKPPFNSSLRFGGGSQSFFSAAVFLHSRLFLTPFYCWFFCRLFFYVQCKKRMRNECHCHLKRRPTYCHSRCGQGLKCGVTGLRLQSPLSIQQS